LPKEASVSKLIDAERLIAACADDSGDAGIRIVSELEPLAGSGSPVKPPVYEGGRYQMDRRWEPPEAESPTEVVVLDQVPSQANRLEAAARLHRELVGLPEMRLDLSALPLPAHLPRSLSSWQFPHRNADAYLRDAAYDGEDFSRSPIGKSLLAATPSAAGPLVAWFPQALLFGFWQSHLGKKQANTKHARAWVSEIIGWRPAATGTRVLGLKGDPLNLNIDDFMTFNPANQQDWELGKSSVRGGNEKSDRLSEIGHGQVLFTREADTAPAGVSFSRITQTATVSFAQLRRVSLGGPLGPAADATTRALLAGIGLFAHVFAFGAAFELRSVADLRTASRQVSFLGARPSDDEVIELPDREGVVSLLDTLREHAASEGVPLDGWGAAPLVLTAKDNLAAAIRATWSVD
jgi:CRISPR-associated protein Csb1